MIKKLSKKNVKDVMKIHKNSIFELWDQLGRRYSYEKIKEFVESVFEKGEVYGYFYLEGLAGVIGLREDIGEIPFILVDKTFQKKGVGKELINFGEEYLRKKGCTRVFLDVLKENKNAISFYKKGGYKKIKGKGKLSMEKLL